MLNNVLIVDDHAVVRDGLANILIAEFRVPAIGQAATVAEALQLAREQKWDLAIVDLSLGGHGGLELIHDLKAVHPRLPILVLTMHAEEQYARRAFKAGASGYITKDRPRSELTTAIGRIAAGGRYVSPALAEKLVAVFAGTGTKSPHDVLSEREFEVMRLIATGNSVKEIAGLLALSDRTVSTYRARLLQKLGMKSNAELTRYALLNNLVQ